MFDLGYRIVGLLTFYTVPCPGWSVTCQTVPRASQLSASLSILATYSCGRLCIADFGTGG